MPSELKTKLQTVKAEKAKLDQQRPLPPNTVASLRKKIMLEWTYHSNAIEGNTLSQPVGNHVRRALYECY